MILIYEPWARKFLHFQFNYSFLKGIKLLYKQEKIVFFGDYEQVQLLKKDFSDNVIFEKLYISNYEKSNKLKILVGEIINVIKIRKFCKNKNIKKIIITNGLPHTILLFKFLKFKIPISFVMHGILEGLWRKNNYLRLNGYVKVALKYKFSEDYSYIILGNTIAKNLLTYCNFLDKKLFIINHPYKFNLSINNKNQINYEELIKIGSIGTGSFEKGTHLIFNLSKYLLEKKIINISLYHIGLLDFKFDNELGVSVVSNKEYLPANVYENYVVGLNYIILFYPQDSYRLTASGAIFDALKFLCPIICFKNDYFCEIFKIAGNIGYLCDSMEEMEFYISEISLRKRSHEYIMQIRNLLNARKYFSSEYIANQLFVQGY